MPLAGRTAACDRTPTGAASPRAPARHAGCLPGYGGPDCALCQAGSFSSGFLTGTNRLPCLANCPAGTTTPGPGSVSRDNCTVCLPGHGGVCVCVCVCARARARARACVRACASVPAQTLCASARMCVCVSNAAVVACLLANQPSTPHPPLHARPCAGCRPGYGGPDCSICPVGQFSPGFTNTSDRADCQPCSPGFSTLAAGSMGPQQCSSECVRGRRASHA